MLTTPPDPPSRPRRAAAVLLAVAMVVTFVPAPVAAAPADADFNPFEINSSDDGGRLPDVVPGWVSVGATARFGYYIGQLDGSDPGDPTVEDLAQDADIYIENHSEAFVDMANKCVPDDRDLTNYDVVKVRLERNDNTAVRYLVGNVTNGTAQSLSVRNETSRTVDYTLTFSGHAPGILQEDLEYVYNNYAQPGNCPDKELQSRLTARYGGGFSWQRGDA